MAGSNKASAGGLIAILIVIAIVTIGGVAGFSFISWPQQDPKLIGTMRDDQLEILAESAARLSVSPLFDLPDPLDRQMALQKMIKDLQADFPQVSEVVVIDEKNNVAYSPQDADVGQPYKAPPEVKQGAGGKFMLQQLASGKAWVAAPVTVGKDKKVIGGVRMTVAMPPVAGSAGGNKSMVLIAGLAALLIGIIVPAAMVSAKLKGLSTAAPSGGDKTNALKGEEAAIAARLKDARAEISRAEELKAQTTALENQMEFLRKQQFEETYKLEGVKKEAAEVAAHLEQRRQMLAATPEERTANLTKEDQDLVARIDAHKKEEQQLALKIQEIRKKMIELDRRVEGRRKD